MGAAQVAPPPGFELDEVPALPPGFELDSPKQKRVEPTGRAEIPVDPSLPPPSKPAPEPSFKDKVVGAGEAALSTATGLTGGAIGMTQGLIDGIIKSIKEGTFGTRAGASAVEKGAAEKAGAYTYHPRTQSGQDQTEVVGKGLQQIVPVAAAQGGQLAGLSASRSIGKVEAPPKAPILSPEMRRLAEVAERNQIPMRPDQFLKSKTAKKLGEASEDMVLAGSKREERKSAWTRAVIKQINPEETADTLTSEVFSKAMDRSGSTIGDVAARTNVKLDGMKKPLDSLVNEASRYGEGDVAKIITNYVEDLVLKADDNGMVPGKALREINTAISSRARGTQNPDLRVRLQELHSIILDAIEKNTTKEDFQAFQAARKEYAIGSRLEPIVAKAVDGEFKPEALMGALTNTKSGKHYMARGMGGEIGDLAKLGQLIKEPPQKARSLEFQAITGAAKTAALPLTYPAAQVYNRAGPAVARAMGKEPAVPKHVEQGTARLKEISNLREGASEEVAKVLDAEAKTIGAELKAHAEAASLEAAAKKAQSPALKAALLKRAEELRAELP